MPRLFVLLATSALGALAVPAPARLVRIQIDSITPAPVDTTPASTLPIPYEIVRGRFFGALDPADAPNHVIIEIDGAPRDANGRVLYSATFAVDPSGSLAVGKATFRPGRTSRPPVPP